MIESHSLRALFLCAALLTAGGCADMPQRQAGVVQKMYVFNCGESTVDDISRWTPGVNAGKPGAFSANCYLIRHAKGYLMWDSGINDGVASMTGGVPSFNYDRDQGLKSMEKIAGVMARTGAELWINHDKPQSDRISKAPAFIE